MLKLLLEGLGDLLALEAVAEDLLGFRHFAHFSGPPLGVSAVLVRVPFPSQLAVLLLDPNALLFRRELVEISGQLEGG